MTEQSQKASNEISLTEIYAGLRNWFLYLLTKWKLLVLIGLAGGVVGFIYASLQKKVYTAELSFALEEKQSSMGAYSAIASQFGIELGGGAGGAFAGDNLVELLKTRLMLEKTLLREVYIDGDTQLLVNRYIDFYKLREKWENKPEMADFGYKANTPRSAFTIKQDSILDIIQDHIRKQMLSVKRVDKKLNLVVVKCSSEDEYFAKAFAEQLMATTSYYYIEGKTKRARANIANIENKIDSVKIELDNRLYGAATVQDRDLNVNRAVKRVPLMKTQIDIQLLTAVYAELSKNLEVSKYTLMREEPLIHIIDVPILPLHYTKLGRLVGLLMFGFMAGLMASFGLIIQKYIADKKQNESN